MGCLLSAIGKEQLLMVTNVARVQSSARTVCEIVRGCYMYVDRTIEIPPPPTLMTANKYPSVPTPV